MWVVVRWRGLVWVGVVWCGLVLVGVGWCGLVWVGVGWCWLLWVGVGWCELVWVGVITNWAYRRAPCAKAKDEYQYAAIPHRRWFRDLGPYTRVDISRRAESDAEESSSHSVGDDAASDAENCCSIVSTSTIVNSTKPTPTGISPSTTTRTISTISRGGLWRQCCHQEHAHCGDLALII